MIGVITSQEVKELFVEADKHKTGLFDQFDSEYNVKEAINKDYQLVEFYREHKLIKLNVNALCYLIRKRNVKEGTNKTPTKDIDAFKEKTSWDLFEERLKEYGHETNS